MRPALVLLVLVSLVLPAAAARPSPATAAVSITDYQFTPSVLAVSPGAKVRWTNDGGFAHTVTNLAGAFDAGSVPPGSTFEHDFPTVGTFAYQCLFHSQMQAKVMVDDPAGLAQLRVSGLGTTDRFGGVQKTVSVTVRNDGRTSAAPSTARVSYLYHGALHAIGDVAVPALGPLGDTSTLTLTWTVAGKLGDFVVLAEADSLHEIVESDEADNTAQATTHVLVGGLDGVDLLDPLE